MKSYWKKREPIGAVRWTGEITPDVTELVGQRKVHVDGERQLIFSNDKSPCRFALARDLIHSKSGENMLLMGGEQFRKL